jgi:hypothetical protein
MFCQEYKNIDYQPDKIYQNELFISLEDNAGRITNKILLEKLVEVAIYYNNYDAYEVITDFLDLNHEFCSENLLKIQRNHKYIDINFFSLVIKKHGFDKKQMSNIFQYIYDTTVLHNISETFDVFINFNIDVVFENNVKPQETNQIILKFPSPESIETTKLFLTKIYDHYDTDEISVEYFINNISKISYLRKFDHVKLVIETLIDKYNMVDIFSAITKMNASLRIINSLLDYISDNKIHDFIINLLEFNKQ